MREYHIDRAMSFDGDGETADINILLDDIHFAYCLTPPVIPQEVPHA